MGIFDNNVHMNGAGTTYQSFLDLADEAEQKGGKIGERTIRLVKAGDGLATTTFHGTTGARADQIGGARKAGILTQTPARSSSTPQGAPPRPSPPKSRN